MPVTFAVGDVLQMRVMTYLSPQLGENLLHYSVTAVGGTPTTDNVAQWFDSVAAPVYKAVLTAAATYVGTNMRRLFPGPTTETLANVNTGLGGSGITPLGMQVSGLITKQTGLVGKANRGRVFLPFPSTADISVTGVPIAGYLTNAGALGRALLVTPLVLTVGASSLTVQPVLLHRATSTVTPLDDFRVSSAFATQRRRGNFGRANPLP